MNALTYLILLPYVTCILLLMLATVVVLSNRNRW
jgi:hypothetical protein